MENATHTKRVHDLFDILPAGIIDKKNISREDKLVLHYMNNEFYIISTLKMPFRSFLFCAQSEHLIREINELKDLCLYQI